MREKSTKQRLVYDFFYPGILGSILYEILPYQNNLIFFMKLFILILFSVDYFHLYFFMDKKFKPEEKDTWSYVFFDFLVALLIFISIRYIDVNRDIVLVCIALIPICFLVYSIILNFNKKFYSLFAIGSIILNGIILYNKEKWLNYDAMILGSIVLMTFVYLAYVIQQISKDKIR